MTNRLAGKVALVTGIGAGIGRGCAMVFAREGATVFGCDIDAARASATVAAAQTVGFGIESAYPIDLTKPADVQRCVDRVIERHGRIDVLVNAGPINPQFAPVSEMSYERLWVPTMVGEVDLVFLMCKAVWPHLIAGGGGSIINFASVAALRGTDFPGMLAHSAGKGAGLPMTRQRSVEGGVHNIRANTLTPGLVATMATASQGLAQRDMSDLVAPDIPLRPIGN